MESVLFSFSYINRKLHCFLAGNLHFLDCRLSSPLPSPKSPVDRQTTTYYSAGSNEKHEKVFYCNHIMSLPLHFRLKSTFHPTKPDWQKSFAWEKMEDVFLHSASFSFSKYIPVYVRSADFNAGWRNGWTIRTCKGSSGYPDKYIGRVQRPACPCLKKKES